MITVKFILLAIILGISAFIGITISKKYSTRVKELKEIQRALHIFEEKIKFTYQPIPDVFAEIADKCSPSIAQIFFDASVNMEYQFAGVAWENALDNSKTKLTKEDIDILKGLSKMLGNTDLDGQVSEIRLTEKFIDTKIKDAEYERNKSEKMYRTLGLTVGLTIVIILVWNKKLR